MGVNLPPTNGSSIGYLTHLISLSIILINKLFDMKITESPKYMLDFASAYVTANYAYSLAKQKSLGILDASEPIHLFTPDKANSKYLVNELVNLPAGMHGFILVEAAPASGITHIKVCFRGVQLTDLGSVKRALEVTGPGINSFIGASKTIMKQIEAVTQKYSAVELEFTGHSMGGADATHSFHDFLYHYTRDCQFHNIEKLTLNTLNAPGNHIAVSDSLNDLLHANHYSSKPLDVEINVAISDGDMLSQIGQNPFIDISPNLATIQLCHVDKVGYDPHSTWGDFFSILPDIIKEMVYLAHTLDPIFSTGTLTDKELSPNFSYQYFNNQTSTENQDINDILAYKWHLASTINCIAESTNALIDISSIIYDYSQEYFYDEEHDNSYADLYADLYVDSNNNELPYLLEQSAMVQIQTQLEPFLVQDFTCLFG